MIQSKDLLMRRLKELAAMLNKQIGSFPDNVLGLTEADIEQQIYTATGHTGDDFFALNEQQLEDSIAKFGEQGGPLMLDFLGNLFYHRYLMTADKTFLKKAQDFYTRYQQQTGIFSMVYFQRMQQS